VLPPGLRGVNFSFFSPRVPPPLLSSQCASRYELTEAPVTPRIASYASSKNHGAPPPPTTFPPAFAIPRLYFLSLSGEPVLSRVFDERKICLWFSFFPLEVISLAFFNAVMTFPALPPPSSCYREQRAVLFFVFQDRNGGRSLPYFGSLKGSCFISPATYCGGARPFRFPLYQAAVLIPFFSVEAACDLWCDPDSFVGWQLDVMAPLLANCSLPFSPAVAPTILTF